MFNIFSPKVPTITADELNQAINEKKPLTLLDVRTDNEYGKGHIADSLHLPIDNLLEKINSLLPDKSKEIVAYCLSGSRSAVAVDEMIKMGYTNIKSLDHGLLAWRAKKYPTVL